MQELLAPAYMRPSVMSMCHLAVTLEIVSLSRNREFVGGFGGMQVGSLRKYEELLLSGYY
jgi:hypothetical protein